MNFTNLKSKFFLSVKERLDFLKDLLVRSYNLKLESEKVKLLLFPQTKIINDIKIEYIEDTATYYSLTKGKELCGGVTLVNEKGTFIIVSSWDKKFSHHDFILLHEHAHKELHTSILLGKKGFVLEEQMELEADHYALMKAPMSSIFAFRDLLVKIYNYGGKDKIIKSRIEQIEKFLSKVDFVSY